MLRYALGNGKLSLKRNMSKTFLCYDPIFRFPWIFGSHWIHFKGKVRSFSKRMSATTQVTPESPHGFRLMETMLRIKDPSNSLPFYDTHFGFKLLHIHAHAATDTSHYYLAILSPERHAAWPAPGSKEAEQALFSLQYVSLCLCVSVFLYFCVSVCVSSAHTHRLSLSHA